MSARQGAISLAAVLAALALGACGGEPPPTRLAPGHDADAEVEPTFIEPVACGEHGEALDGQNACLSCHQGIEPIRCADSGMAQRIAAVARSSGANSRCVVCHGGDPTVRRPEDAEPGTEAYDQAAEQAHRSSPPYFADHPGPKRFYPDPGSPWINAHSCGPCHRWQVQAERKSLMMTEAGKIQGTAWGFGGLSGYQHGWANYPVRNEPEDEVVGTEAFKDYLAALGRAEPNVFVDEMIGLPRAPHGAADVSRDPSLAAFTYARGECQRCHLGVRGMQRYGDYRGMGCSACHIPYGNAGRYQGKDPTIDREAAGHVLVHSIQSGHDSPVRARTVAYSGIPVETCTSCHNRGRRIGVSFQGLMETPYEGPWTAEGEPQRALHGKRYLKMRADLHAEKGFLCQDCHTSLDVHSPNRLIGAISGAVEIECFDCHGTPQRFPWELPLGYGDEYAETPQRGAARGTADELPRFAQEGKAMAKGDGYLLSARGNPLGNAARKGDRVEVLLASGELKTLAPLKTQAKEQRFSLEGRVAMAQVPRHLERMECYACHASWAPQCYGCHIKIDYTKDAAHYDWVELGRQHRADGLTEEHTLAAEAMRLSGEIVETRSYLRWEDPALGQNGEGRISPVVPGCQTSLTVINAHGKTVVANHIFRIPDVEGAGPEGQLAADMSPLQPHTVQKGARSCESCHADPKALGYGIRAGAHTDAPDRDHHVDLMTARGEPIVAQSSPQMHAVENLSHDWSRFVSEDGQQLQTVGHHFALSRPLNDAERAHMQREGTCLACHQEIPDGSLAVSLLHHIAEKGGLLPRENAAHAALIHRSLLLSGWVEVAALLGALGGALGAVIWWRRRRRGGGSSSRSSKPRGRKARQSGGGKTA